MNAVNGPLHTVELVHEHLAHGMRVHTIMHMACACTPVRHDKAQDGA